MHEIYEFRVFEKYAHVLFGEDEGKQLGELVRKVELPLGDPKLLKVGEANKLIRKKYGDFFFASWTIRRSYAPSEIEKAELFLLNQIKTFEPAGEQCGTKYDEASACPSCKSGAKQISPLFLAWSSIPKKADIARTIAGEIVVSRRMMELFDCHSLTGATFGPVCRRSAPSAPSKDRFQLLITSCDAEVAFPTKIGIDPFDEDAEGQFRCSRGDLLGLARLSEVSISRSSYNRSDIVASHQFVGSRRGLLRPERFLLVSPKLARLMKAENLKGCDFEIAHLV